MLTVNDLASAMRGQPEAVRQAVTNRAREIEVIAVSEMKLAMTQGHSPDGTPYVPLSWPRIRGGDKPLLDRGLLRACLSALATGDSLTLSATAPGARVHQFGATITAKPGKALAIPMTKEALYAGSPRNFPGLFRVRGGLATAVETRSRRGRYGTRVQTRVVLQYLFKKSVTIPARPYLGLTDNAIALIVETYTMEYLEITGRAIGSELRTTTR